MKMYRWITGWVMGSCALAYGNGQPSVPTSWVYNPTHLPVGATAVTIVFSPTASINDINTVAQEIYAINGGTMSSDTCSQQFSNNRYAMLFQPGSYPGSVVYVGYYTSVAGLGASSAGTVLGDVCSPQNCGMAQNPGALNTFWRSAENFTTIPTVQPIGPGLTSDNTMVWATSQACPLRAVNVEGKLWLFQITGPPDYASTYCSGGFIADSVITDEVLLGGQQQYLLRNSVVNTSSTAGVWNYVFVGCASGPGAQCYHDTFPSSAPPVITSVAATPLIAEKPFLSYSGASYYLNIPEKQVNKVGSSLTSPPTVTSVPFNYVYVTSPSVDTAASINTQIQEGNHILLSPGIYTLEGSINLNHNDTCLIGLGFPTLISNTGQPCITVTGDRVRVGGLILQAGPESTSSLLEWGELGDSITEGYLYDCFSRIGRFDVNNQAFNQADTSIQINSSNIVCDNLWLWRADHDAINTGDTIATGVTSGHNPSLHGLVIGQPGSSDDAQNVIVYGLAAEHQLEDIVQWYGNNGQCYFLQSEYPYDAGATYASEGFVAYRVGSQVSSHQGYGMGVYSNFYGTVFPQSGFIVPSVPGVQLHGALTRFLNNAGGILAVVNNQGRGVTEKDPGIYPVCQSLTESIRTVPLIRVALP